MSVAFLQGAAEHQQLEWLQDSTVTVLLDGAATDGQLTVIRSDMQRGATAPLHEHAQEDEMFVLLAGDMVFWVGEQVHEVGAGASVFLPRGMPHSYRVLSETADFLTLCTPSGIEAFFREAGHDRSEPRPHDFAVTLPRLAQAAAGVGMSILGPPPEWT